MKTLLEIIDLTNQVNILQTIEWEKPILNSNKSSLEVIKIAKKNLTDRRNPPIISTNMTKQHPQMTNKDLLILTIKLFAIWIAGAIIQAL